MKVLKGVKQVDYTKIAIQKMAKFIYICVLVKIIFFFTMHLLHANAERFCASYFLACSLGL